MTPPIRLATVPISPIRIEHAAPQPIRLQQLAQGAPVLRLVSGGPVGPPGPGSSWQSVEW